MVSYNFACILTSSNSKYALRAATKRAPFDSSAFINTLMTAQAETLQQLLVNVELQQRLKGRTLIVDEAGLISTRQMHDLCVVAQQHSCRVLLVGDIKQHASVEAGDALRALQRFAQVLVVGLTQIRRQQDPEYRKAVSLLCGH